MFCHGIDAMEKFIPRRVFSNCIKPHSGLDTVTSIVEETQVTITTCFLYVSRQHTQQWRWQSWDSSFNGPVDMEEA